MLKIEVNTYEDLDNWLADNYDFEDGHVLAIKESPLGITVGYNVFGDYKANSERHIRSFKLTPSKILDWTYNERLFDPSDHDYIENIKAVKSEKGICLKFVPMACFELRTDSLIIEEQELIVTTFKPYTNEKEIDLIARMETVPKPGYWTQRLKEIGHHVSFRYYGGEERLHEQVPYPDYQGYFIQLTDRLDITTEGIFIQHLRTENGILILNFENKDKELKVVWEALTLILSELPDAKMKSGNCEFSGPEWRKYLIDRKLPTA